ncbi:2'-5' RNA ligase [Herbidospora galbida]|uniref:2'-5' RNA ligase n=1 Tax=Herbidospora galbida TaxID=2575442 RepID=A0A4U3M6V3_9ACTN|nr:RNA ligase [Herbidospora galbida]TKK84665.1 2'-5' RNA ligase [Herbidospora galbida]
MTMQITELAHVTELLETYQNKVVKLDELVEAISQGYVRVSYHPEFPLAIFNYTEKAVQDAAWSPAVRASRGLIIDNTGRVIARPFPKFFNHNEAHAPSIHPANTVRVTDKLDGSLGVIYVWEGETYIATRGSFVSAQAIHATKVLREKYPTFRPPDGVTVLVEIVYPQNRIVVDYGALDDLILLGAVANFSGLIFSQEAIPEWTGPVAATLPADTFADALALVDRQNAEGVVVLDLFSNQQVKIKQQDYVAKHRIVTRTNPRVIWEYLAVNSCQHIIHDPKHWGSKLGIDPKRAAGILATGPNWLEIFVQSMPKDFSDWLCDTARSLQAQMFAVWDEIDDVEAGYFGSGKTRAEIAEEIKDHPHKAGIFASLDDKNLLPYCWKAVYPPASRAWASTE